MKRTRKEKESIPEQKILFESGKDGYTAYRIPALVINSKGTIFAFCEGRRNSFADSGQIDILMRRSFDNGQTWDASKVVVSKPGMTCGNPNPVIDAQTGSICLLFCTDDGPINDVLEGNATRKVWITRSGDNGETWSEPEDLTGKLKLDNWTWYAIGPGHGIQLRSGRLVVSCNHVVGVNLKRGDPNHTHIIYSDDHGMTWNLGGICDQGSNESCLVETIDGSLYVNSRNPREPGRRTFSWSEDDGFSFGPRQVDETLIEPPLWGGCQASIVRYSIGNDQNKGVILFANPVSREEIRQNMTVRVSYDECETWSVGKVLHPGPAAYSDLVVAKDKTILCLYECGDEHPYQTLTMARFDLKFLQERA